MQKIFILLILFGILVSAFLDFHIKSCLQCYYQASELLQS